MKRVLSSLLLLALLPAGNAFSQKAFANLGFGYGFGSGTALITTKGTATNQEGVYGSYGEGIRFGVSGGMMFSKIIGADFGFLYLVGKSFEGSAQNNGKVTQSSSGFVFAPGFVLSTGAEKIEPYARMGLLLGFLKETYERTSATEELSATISGGMSLGFLGGVGAAFHLNQMFSIYSELTIISLTQNPSTLEVTKHTVNGQAAADQGKKYDYKDSYDPTNVAPNTFLSVRNPFSSIGITIGGRVHF